MGPFRHILGCILAFGFLLGTCRGYLALWKDGNPEPVQIFPVPADTLPEADRHALAEGIRARSQLELDEILETYLS